MNIIRTCILSLVLGILLSSTPQSLAAANQDLSTLQTRAYVTLVRADQAKDQKDYTSAVGAYKSAFKLYRQISKQDPSWHQDIVQYRLTYCANQVKMLNKKIEAAGSQPSTPSSRAELEKYKGRYIASLEENKYLRSRLDDAEKAAGKSKAAENLQAQLKKRDKENQSLRESLEASRSEASDRNNQAMARLKEKNASLSQELNVARQESELFLEKAAEIEAFASVIEQASAENDSLRKTLSETQAEVEEILALQASLDKSKGSNRKNDALEKEIRRLKEKLSVAKKNDKRRDELQAQFEKTIEDLNDELKRTRKAKSGRDKSRTLKQKLKESDKILSATEKELRESKNEASSLRKSANSLQKKLSKRKSVEKEYAELKKDHDSLQSSLEKLQGAWKKEARALKKKLADKEERVARLEAAAKKKKSKRSKKEKPTDKLTMRPPTVTMAASARNNKSIGIAPPAVPAMSKAEISHLIQRGYALENRGDFEGALAIYNRALSSDPESISARIAKGRSLLHLDRPEESVAALSTVDPHGINANTQLLLGIAQYKYGDYKGSSKTLKTVVQLQPSNAVARNTLGAVWMELGQHGNARKEFAAALKSDPTLGDAHYNLAQLLRNGSSKDKTEAREHYLKALELGIPADRDLENAIGQ